MVIAFANGYLFSYLNYRDLGRAPEILIFDSNRVSIRKADGVLVVGTSAAFMSHIHRHANTAKFTEAKRICSYVNVRKT